MTLQSQIDQDLKEAMRAKDRLRLNALRMLKAACKNAAIEQGGADALLDDNATITIIRKQIKQRQDSVAGFEKGGRTELAAAEKSEMEVLSAYLPKGLSDEEVVALVRTAIAETGATSRKEMGAVMKVVTAQAAGRVDGRTLSMEVQKQLN